MESRPCCSSAQPPKGKKNILLKLLNDGGIFILMVMLTFGIVFKDIRLSQVAGMIKEANPFYLLAGVGAMMIFILCEATSIGLSLKLLGYRPGLAKCIKYSSAGFFFSSITPSASGGQPMQMYYMHKDKIELSHSALALLIQLASYQFVTVSFAVAGLMMNSRMVAQSPCGARLIIFLGLGFNLAVLVLILTAVFSKRLSNGCLALVQKVLLFFGYKKVNQFEQKAQKHLQEYQRSASYFLNNKATTVKIVFITCLQITAVHSIPYWVYRSLGLQDYSFLTVLSIQAVLYISVSALPLPGAVGASESGFMILFKTLFPAQLLSEGMLLSRGVSFYLFVFVTGVMLGGYALASKRKALKGSAGFGNQQGSDGPRTII